jgi:hypothetical protein
LSEQSERKGLRIVEPQLDLSKRRITVTGRYVPEASYSIDFPDCFYDGFWNKVFPFFACDHTSSDFCAGVCFPNIKGRFFYAKPGFSEKLDN